MLRLLDFGPRRGPARFALLPALLAGLAHCTASLPILASPATSLYEAPGKLVDVGGYRLHIHCQGQGLPALIFDSGTGGFSLEWMQVQKVLSRHTRVCSYDRAGYGWSDMGPLPRTSRRITQELRTLLGRAGVSGPYIVAGHSFGGYTAQLFARHYPQDTAGLVLIDSSHPEQVERLPAPERGEPRTDIHRARSYLVSKPVMHPNFPDETKTLAHWMMQRWRQVLTWREEMNGLPVSARQVRFSSPMPKVPMVVLTRGLRVWPNNDYGNEMERIWMELQDELSLLSDNSVHLIAEHSGHLIHLDQPELVINAVQTFLNANFTDE